jgi:hypothetical protein
MSCKTNPSCYSIAGESFDLSNLDDLAAIQTHDFLNKWFLPLVILARFNAGFFFLWGKFLVTWRPKQNPVRLIQRIFVRKASKSPYVEEILKLFFFFFFF